MGRGPANSNGAAVTLRVAEACVEDISHAVARFSCDDLHRIGARVGDVLKITGSTSAVALAEVSDDQQPGMVQVDGTTRSNCGVHYHHSPAARGECS